MSQQKPHKDKLKNNINTAARLSGSAIQMGIVIYLAVKGGQWLDSHFGTEKVFLPICTLLGVGVSIYLVVQQLKKINNN
ncbi:AtpZ/AtpI family protein [Flagellimonas sp.]|uniref:AtpZ/AtpI family protein n=1 Tax=Flagellimonas sp. TaxID=2058762 RepID=UPI003AB30CD9